MTKKKSRQVKVGKRAPFWWSLACPFLSAVPSLSGIKHGVLGCRCGRGAQRTGEFGCPRPTLSASENTGVFTDTKIIFTGLTWTRLYGIESESERL